MPITRTRILLWAALSGVLWSFAWPAIGGFTALAFVAWLPLLHAERLHDARTVGRKRAFVPYVLLAVFIWNAASSWWFFLVSEPFGTRLVSGASPMVVNSLLMLVPWWLKRWTHRAFGPSVAAIAFVAFWLAFERVHHGWDLQWPWFSLGNVFGTRPQWIQWYEHTGMLGGSLWILLVNIIVDRAITNQTRRGAYSYGAAALVLIALPLTCSLARYYRYDPLSGPTLEAVVVQPCIDPYSEKFGGVDPLEQLERMLTLARDAMSDTTALVVMPETALQEATYVDMLGQMPVFHGLWENAMEQARSTQRLERFQEEAPNAAILCGMSSRSMGARGAPHQVAAKPLFNEAEIPEGEQRWYMDHNAALFLPSAGPVEVYNKSKLVAGVESMPFEAVLGQVQQLAVDLGGVSGSLGMQQEREVLVDPAHDLRLVPAICYESVFGEHVAAHVRNGGNLIAVITNDAWWGNSPGYHQHLTFSTIRAIETRRDVVRSANTGISCSVDQRGDVHEPSAWWTPVAQRHTVHLNEELTFFVRHGDLVGRAAVGVTVVLLFLLLLHALRKRMNATPA